MLQFIFRGLDDVRLQCMLGYSRTYLLLRQHLWETPTILCFFPTSIPRGSLRGCGQSLELRGGVVMTCSAFFFFFFSHSVCEETQCPSIQTSNKVLFTF